jgi:phosphomannomutase
VALATNDGFKYFTTDGSWLMVRFSGTEPLVRIYTEGTSQGIADSCLAAGEALVRGG